MSRQRSIYYDTDSISEIQQESLRLCPNCAGALRIDTSATTGSHVLCIHLPRTACAECRAQAEAWFAEGERSYSAVYLQDLERDEYRVARR